MAYFGHFFSVYPAYAGMILTPIKLIDAPTGVPRVCGNDLGQDERLILPVGVPRVCGNDPCIPMRKVIWTTCTPRMRE